MANNELFYRAAREALGDDTCISGLVIDLNLAVESYLQEVTEDGIVSDRVKEEIENGYTHAQRFIQDLFGWKEFVYPGGEPDASEPKLRKHTVFEPCDFHAAMYASETRYRRGEVMCEGGWANSPCPDNRCQMKPGTDFYTASFVAANPIYRVGD